MVTPKCFAKIIRRQEGSIAVLMGAIMLLLIMAVGAAVDMTRAQILQQRLSSALDAAGLAAAKVMASPPANVCNNSPPNLPCMTQWTNIEANRFFQANFPVGYLGSNGITANVTVMPDLATLNLSVSTVQNTVFMRVFGLKTMNIGAQSTVTRNADLGIELVLVLDNTGSMEQILASQPVSKLQALKNSITGSGGLLDILYGASPSVNNLYVGVVPFSATVNVGNKIVTSAYDGINPGFPNPATVPIQGQWAGCVNARPIPYTLTDDKPVAGGTLLHQFFFRSRNSSDPSVWTFVYYNQWTNIFGGAPYNFGFPSPDPTVLGTNTTMGPNLDCPLQVTPLTTNKATIANAVNSLSAPSGDSILPEGLVWGWRMLSPNWRGVWQGTPAGLPQDYTAPNNRKVVVMMTDGANHLSIGSVTAYGFFGDLSPDLLGTTDQQSADAIVDNNLRAICNSMKQNNKVTIYTIAFGEAATNNPLTENDRLTKIDVPLMQSCATDADHFFIAPTNDALQAAFQQIGNSLANLRVSH